MFKSYHWLQIRNWRTLKLLTILFISSLPYLSSINGDFVFDDSEAIIKNKDVTSDSWLQPFYNDFWGTNIKSDYSHKSYRPLTIWTFRINYLLGGKQLSGIGFKVTNLLCHVTCCILVWKVFDTVIIFTNVNKNSGWMDIALMASLMFAVHPVHVEAISGIVGRADILAANAFFLAFLCYHKAMVSVSWRFYIYMIATMLLSATSMLFKENGITILGFCLCYDIIMMTDRLFTNNQNIKKKTRQFKMRIIIIIIYILLLLYARWMIMGGTKPIFKVTDNPAAFTDSIITKILTYSYIYFLNLVLLVWPYWLCYDWSMGCIPLIESFSDYRTFFALLIYVYGMLVIIAVLRAKNRSTKRIIMLTVLLTCIPFLPAANFFYPVGFVIAERILYIPSAGYCLLVTLGLKKIVHKRKDCIFKIGMLAFLLLILIYGLRSWQRAHEWQNEYKLFVSGLSVCPLNAKVHYNVAKVADARQQTDWALHEYKESIRLYPEYYQSMNNLANLLKSQKQFADAEYYLRTAINYKKDFPAAWMNLGIVLSSTRRLEEALDAYKTALHYRNNYPDCYYNVGNLYLEMNKTKEAIENWFQAINLNTSHTLAWTNLLTLLDNSGQSDKALEIIPKAIAFLPKSPSVNFAVANIYGKMDRYVEAEKYFKKAISLFGSRVQALHYANLGVLYHRWKRYDLAEESYERALKIDPSFKSALLNLKSLKKLKQ